MEIVCIDKTAFAAMCNHFREFEDRVNSLFATRQDLALKNWMDNQNVCQVLRISKRTLQVYREKGLIPFARIKHKIFYKPEDIQRFIESNYHPIKKKRQ